MEEIKPFSGQLIVAFKDALAAIYWRKNDMRQFIASIIKNQQVMGTIDWDQPKNESASLFVDHVIKYQNQYQVDIKVLIVNISNMSDFSHFNKWDNPERKIKLAKEAVAILRQHAKEYFEIDRERESVKKKKVEFQNAIKTSQHFSNGLESIRTRFLNLETNSLTPQAKGFEFERILGDLFYHYDLNIRSPFKVQGEQIDGAFTLNNEEFLLEAKYLQRPVRASEVHSFAGKVNGNLKTTLGLYVSLGGYSPECLESLARQSSKAVILMDGMDLMSVLENRISLSDWIFHTS